MKMLGSTIVNCSIGLETTTMSYDPVLIGEEGQGRI